MLTAEARDCRTNDADAFTVLDSPLISGQLALKFVVLGKKKEAISDDFMKNYVLLVQAKPDSHGGRQVSQRVGVSILPGKCVRASGEKPYMPSDRKLGIPSKPFARGGGSILQRRGPSCTGSLMKQLQERRLQANMAGRDIKGTDKQLVTSRMRVEMCDRAIQLQQQQADHARDTEEWLRTKYSSEQLYTWMDGVVRNLHNQTYLVANDLAQQAQATFRFEKGDQSVIVSFASKQDG
ncbi:hypothetical protein EDB80DRAFT_690119 [Ilyonectria destructans]|nr:hypothetical protein EDB80DRAFT_690119 [Ilyonectria destructans]